LERFHDAIENEVVIENSAVENVIVKKDNREKSSPVMESIGTQFPNKENNINKSGIDSDSSVVRDNNESRTLSGRLTTVFCVSSSLSGRLIIVWNGLFNLRGTLITS
jgi:hypothetical protein